jgi:hypothetical protein
VYLGVYPKNNDGQAPQFESGHNCSECFVRLRKPASEGPYQRRPTWIGSFAAKTSTAYRRLLDRVTEGSHREQIINLLAEEQRKQKDAGDPVS